MPVAETPASLGFRWPAEWEAHEATWLSWPHNRETWPGCLEAAEAAFVAMVRALHEREIVHVNVGDAALEARARRLLADGGVDPAAGRGVHFHPIPTDDAWVRDHGAVFLVHEVEVDGARERRLSTRLVNVPEPNEPILLPPDAGATLAFPIERVLVGDFSDLAVSAQGLAQDLALASGGAAGQTAGVTIVENDGFGGIPRLGVRLEAPALLPSSVEVLDVAASYDRMVFVNEDSSVGFWAVEPLGLPQQLPTSTSAPPHRYSARTSSGFSSRWRRAASIPCRCAALASSTRPSVV